MVFEYREDGGSIGIYPNLLQRVIEQKQKFKDCLMCNAFVPYLEEMDKDAFERGIELLEEIEELLK